MHNVGGDACIGPRADAGIRPCKPGMPPCRKRDCIHSAGKSLDFTEFFLFLLPALLQKVWIFGKILTGAGVPADTSLLEQTEQNKGAIT
jgi:hypothetical protein